METIIRLKRPLEEPPSETLVLNYKKRKLCSETTPALLKLTGTTLSQEEDISKYVSDFKQKHKEKFTAELKKHRTNLEEKLRSEVLENSKENRYKIVNCLRTGKESDGEYTLYDLEVGEDQGNSSEKLYVYDLYYVSSEVLQNVNDYVSLCPVNDLVFETENDTIEQYDDSDDSNAENNWRNSYPDESDCESINEDDIIAAVKNCNINDQLSSDDDEYYEEDNAGIKDSDEEKYGKMYAKFKAKYNESDSDDSLDSLDKSDLQNYYY